MAMVQNANDDGEFKQPRKRRPKKTQPSVSLSQKIDRVVEELDRDGWTSQALQTIRDALDASTCPTPLNILCLGLGSPDTSPTSRAQLAFLFQLCTSLNIDPTRVSLYDPVFSGEDIALLTERGMHIAIAPPDDDADDHNLHRTYACAAPTLVYMPHCDLELHEDVLRANPPPLSRDLVLVCNRLGDYVENIAQHKLESRVPVLLRTVPLLACRPLPSSVSWPGAFNNTAIQFLPPANKSSECDDACSTEVMDHPAPRPGSTPITSGATGAALDMDAAAVRTLPHPSGRLAVGVDTPVEKVDSDRGSSVSVEVESLSPVSVS